VRPFDLAAEALLRTTLVQLGPADHLLLLCAHHTVIDGWSVGILLRDLAAFYEAAVIGRPAALPPLELQYADYAVWQGRRLRGAALETLVAFWRSGWTGCRS